MVLTPISTKVVGVSFIEDYPQNIFRLSQRYASGESSVSLERDINNQYDNNAIKVIVDNEMVGHIPAVLAKFIAPEMDNGVEWFADIESILVSVENMDNPGIKIIIWREDENA
jgi:hypothetical protein